MRGYIMFEGRLIKWSDLVRLKREQREAQKKAQLDLFDNPHVDRQPPSQKKASSRYTEPTLFDK